MKTYDLIFDKSQSLETNREDINDYFLQNETNSANYLPNFNKINIIVGANNSGKSRFMRYLMSFDKFTAIKELDKVKKLIIEYNIRIISLNNEIDSMIQKHSEISERTIYVNGINTDRQKVEFFQNNKLEELRLENPDVIISLIRDNKSKLIRLEQLRIIDPIINEYSLIELDFFKKYDNIKRYYIPTLRTAHSIYERKKENDSFLKIEDDIFFETLTKHYKLNDIKVFTGIHLYKEILNSRNAKKSVRNEFENFEKFIATNFFGGKRIDIVAEFNKDESRIGNNESEIISVHFENEEETRELHHLGDGIQALIVLMYQIFMAEKNSFIFIDEPELNLHPGMQRLFLEQITSNRDLEKKNLTYIITTHSNHFLDLTIDEENVSIYSFSPKETDSKQKQFIIKNVNAGDNEILKVLGVNNSSVFMANCSVWVEGISDRNYIKAFLKSYCDSEKKPYPKEDIDFAFFEYAGSNIDHYIFQNEIENEDKEIILKDIKALALNNKIFLLADSDAVNKSTKKGIRLKELEAIKTSNFTPKIIWEFREIENLLTNDIWKEILINLCNKKLVKSHKKEVLKRIDDALLEINYSSFSKQYVGEFLEKIRNKMGKISSTFILNQSSYEVKSNNSFGTIINKRDLSELIYNKNFSWEILSKNKDVESLTIEIYNFITKK